MRSTPPLYTKTNSGLCQKESGDEGQPVQEHRYSGRRRSQRQKLRRRNGERQRMTDNRRLLTQGWKWPVEGE